MTRLRQFILSPWLLLATTTAAFGAFLYGIAEHDGTWLFVAWALCWLGAVELAWWFAAGDAD